MHNIKLVIAYDGTNYLGWQKTPIGKSVEGVLQQVIEQIVQHPILLQAASRTDRGVHAEGQVVNFLLTKPQLDLSQFRSSITRLLPKDIVVLESDEMPLSFHPTLDSIGKEYHYFVDFGRVQIPHHRHYSWHVYYPVDLDLIKQALKYFIGSQNFSSFCNVKKFPHYGHYIREIQTLELHQTDDHRFSFHIRGNHFLYKMVRIIVGTLIAIGRGKLRPDQLPSIFESRNRLAAGVTAPAHGLFLHKVFYT